MTPLFPNTTPQTLARLGGALYLAIIVCGAFSEGFVMSQLVVSGDAAATARNILAAPGLWQCAVLLNVLLVLCAVPLQWIEYVLLRPVHHRLALLALVLNLVSLSVESVSKVFMLLVLPTLENTQYMHTLGPQQVAMLAHLLLHAHGVAFNVALLFFGLTCLVNGYLIFHSGYLPKVLGVGMQAAGGSYVASCLAALFAPALAEMLLPALLLVPFLGELCLCLWLLLKGVNITTWKASAAQSQKLRPVLVGE
ncbi:DUF4386 domain-containing protein [Hymenobacter taeanensis]|uniref:DUF4386 domain-containing protein n=1 Tax=Hymenobacter taeanensis TaxID=2735321 RepID=A0A6M6BLD8_9BACT|nr:MULTISPECIES: DUF4386 domain-containing protein [Hymenobacter]QJX48273.1 DUF4386 domain-containing protein [Hymenobacter taeanensis]UOQ82244.1 DUF4386 domain-containing protein [Hymenobacter sp. 5414T-23]